MAERIETEMRRTGKGLKVTINEALRRGLRIGPKRPASPRFKVQPHDFKVKPGVDLDRMNQLVDELDAEEVRLKIHR